MIVGVCVCLWAYECISRFMQVIVGAYVCVCGHMCVFVGVYM